MEALTNGGSCKDECGICNGDGYEINCKDPLYIRTYNDSTGTCLNMDCSGECGGTESFNHYYFDKDLDGWGARYAGYDCSSSMDSVSVQMGDMDDSIICISNNIDHCEICDGTNLDQSSCTNSEFDNKIDCELSGSSWTKLFDGPDLDCNGLCYETSDPDSIKAHLDVCSDTCCGGNTGIKCSYYNDVDDFGGFYDCLGECEGEVIIDECGICNGESKIDTQGNCVFTVYPGDTDMNSSVNLSDLNPIIKYWGKRVSGRGDIDIYGNILSSKSSWSPQGQPMTIANECILYADANGDGLINISDVTTVLKNQGKSHSFSTLTDCTSLTREEDLYIYYSIFESLPFGELKQAMAAMYGFEMPPERFRVYPNYPNPFNPETTINYEISEIGIVDIQVFNLRGQRINENYKLELNPGYYSYTWNASNFSSGIYYYRVFFNNSLIVNRKMSLIK